MPTLKTNEEEKKSSPRAEKKGQNRYQRDEERLRGVGKAHDRDRM